MRLLNAFLRRVTEQMAASVPLEVDEQRELAQWLDSKPILWCWVPNGNNLSKAQRGISKAIGLKSGVPDILIFTPPPGAAFVGEFAGVAIELKRQKVPPSAVSESQKEWLHSLECNGWYTEVCRGAGEARELLLRLGYGER